MKKQTNEIKYKNYKIKTILTYVNFILSIGVIVLSVLSLFKIISFIFPLILFIINTFLIKYRNNIDKKK